MRTAEVPKAFLKRTETVYQALWFAFIVGSSLSMAFLVLGTVGAGWYDPGRFEGRAPHLVAAISEVGMVLAFQAVMAAEVLKGYALVRWFAPTGRLAASVIVAILGSAISFAVACFLSILGVEYWRLQYTKCSWSLSNVERGTTISIVLAIGAFILLGVCCYVKKGKK